MEPRSCASMDEPTTVTSFKAWFRANNGYFHPDAVLVPGPFGCSVHAKADLFGDAKIVSCPFYLAITPDLALEVLRFLGLSDWSRARDTWSARQLISCYICLHWICGERHQNVLRHAPYLATLPSPSVLRTSLHFTAEELDAFKGSNLYGATFDRHRDWQDEWLVCQRAFTDTDVVLGVELTWERYLTAATYISSRAFPSSVLSPTPSLASNETSQSHPVLLPGVDSLNHARAQKVSWVVEHTPTAMAGEQSASTQGLSISLVLHEPARIGQELFNNYGPKPNAELILGYGFSIPRNPDDTIVLQLGGAGNESLKWEIGRGARGVEEVWLVVLEFMRETQREGEEREYEYELHLDAADMLSEMTLRLMNRLPERKSFEGREGGMRAEVYNMWEDYFEAQRSILESVMAFLAEKENAAIRLARELGIDVVVDDKEDF